MMNDKPLDTTDDETDIREIFSTIWAEKWLVVAVMIITTFLAIYYGFTAKQKYEATAVFLIEDASSGIQIPGEFAGLASLAGLASGNGSDKGVFDRLQGTNFINALSDELNFEADPYLNPRDNGSGVLNISSLKQLINGLFGIESHPLSEADKQARIKETIVDRYLKNVSVSETENASIEIVVTHENAQRAADIANGVVERAISEIREEKNIEQSNQLDYLSGLLAEASTEIDRAQKAVTDFSFANSLASTQALLISSQLMSSLREDLIKTDEMIAAIEVLNEILVRVEASGKKAPDKNDYLELQIRAPVVDSIPFRRLVGVPETLDAWLWPSVDRLEFFLNTLKDRKARINRSIAESRDEAERYASSTDALALLEREVKVAQSTYEVLIEQVKAQALIAGYKGDVAKIYQFAAAPTKSTQPKKILIVALGVIIGMFLGTAAALLMGHRRGYLYSNNTIINEVAANTSLKLHPSYGNYAKSLKALFNTFKQVKNGSLSELLVIFNSQESKLGLFLATSPKIDAFPISLWVSQRLINQKQKTALIVLGSHLPSGVQLSKDESLPDGLLKGFVDNVDVFAIAPQANYEDVITSGALQVLIQHGAYDRFIVSASAEAAVLSLYALNKSAPFIALITRPGFSHRDTIENIRHHTAINVNVSLLK